MASNLDQYLAQKRVRMMVFYLALMKDLELMTPQLMVVYLGTQWKVSMMV